MTKPLITIGIAGGTGAGKSTFSRKLFESLGGAEHVTYLVHDSYYKDISHLSLEERSKTNFDDPSSLDTDLLVQHIRQLKLGNAVQVPTYDFATHSRTSTIVTMEPKKMILVEGILILCNTELVQELDVKVFVDADSDIRLARRLSRDTRERGRSVDDVLKQYQLTVRPSHDQWVEPCKKIANLVVHTVGNSMETAIQVLEDHMQARAGLLVPATPSGTPTLHCNKH